MGNQEQIAKVQKDISNARESILNFFIANLSITRQFRASTHVSAFGDVLYDKYYEDKLDKQNNEIWLNYTEDLFRIEAEINISIKPNRKNAMLTPIRFITPLTQLTKEFFEILEEIFIFADQVNIDTALNTNILVQIHNKKLRELYLKILRYPGTIEKAF